MLRSLYAGVSGLKQHQTAMDVIANNIANVNTVGYKGSRAIFQDLLSQTISGAKSPTSSRGGINSTQIGLGSSMGSIDTIFTTGTPLSTDNQLDLAISGEGFFVVRGNTVTEQFYSKAGDFRFDNNGSLTNSGGYIVQGWMADDTGAIPGDALLGDIQLLNGQDFVSPRATTEVSMAGVLDTRAEPTILEYQPFLTHSSGTDTVIAAKSSTGTDMDLVDGENVRVKAHATGTTDIRSIYDDDYNSADFDGLTLTIDVSGNGIGAGAAATITYAAGMNMTTFAAAIDTQLSAIAGVDVTVTVANDGEIQILNNDPDALNIDRIQVNNTSLRGILDDLQGTIASGGTKNSDEFFYVDELIVGSDFTDLQSLGIAIAGSISGDGKVIAAADGQLNVVYDATTGLFTYTNTTAGTDITEFKIDKAYPGETFEKNMIGTTSTIDINASTNANSNRFLSTVADDNVELDDLYNSSGANLNLGTGTPIITYTASIGGTALNTQNYGVVGTNTLSHFLDDIAASMNLDRNDLTITDGKIVIQGENGLPNEIDYINMTLSGSTDDVIFNNYMNYEETQNASGGELSTSQTLYDSQGNPHVVLYNYTMYNDSLNQWKLSITSNDSSDTLTLDPPFNNSEAIVQFDSEGQFQNVSTVPIPPANTSTVAPLTFTLQPGNGATPMANITVDLGGNSETQGGMILSSADGTITFNDQDGYTIGSIDGVSINNAGEVIASYTNGEVRAIAQLALATFTNEQGLVKLGGSLFGVTPNSGEAAIGRAGAGGRGDVVAGQLENSNVDLATEFVNMITIQRGYQANSRVITTSDEMLQELMSLKR